MGVKNVVEYGVVGNRGAKQEVGGKIIYKIGGIIIQVTDVTDITD